MEISMRWVEQKITLRRHNRAWHPKYRGFARCDPFISKFTCRRRGWVILPVHRQFSGRELSNQCITESGRNHAVMLKQLIIFKMNQHLQSRERSRFREVDKSDSNAVPSPTFELGAFAREGSGHIPCSHNSPR